MIHAGRHPRKFLGAFTTLIFLNLLFGLQHFSIAYVNSSFLAQFFSPESVSIIYVVTSLANIGSLLMLPFLIRQFGVWPLVIIFIPVLQVMTLLFGFSNTAIAAIIFFIIRSVSANNFRYLLDLYVEAFTKDESKTGNMRGLFITGGSIGVLFGPIAASVLVFGTNYHILYAFSALLLTPVFVIALLVLHKHKPKIPKSGLFIESFKSLFTCRRSVRHTMLVNLVFQTWGLWIVIYAPLYLIQAGFEWQFIGSLIALALIPYVLLEIPLGIIADKITGEKEIMVTGLFILSFCTLLLSLIPLTHIMLWSLAFIATRVGGAMLEISTESYFFKQVDETDSALISMFRILGPLGGVLAPLIALAILPIAGLQYMFGFFAALILIGVPAALRIHDTR